MWVRGLKHGLRNRIYHRLASHPVWVRGLKLALKIWCHLVAVAPRVGAWIETTILKMMRSSYSGRTPCGCVD